MTFRNEKLIQSDKRKVYQLFDPIAQCSEPLESSFLQAIQV